MTIFFYDNWNPDTFYYQTEVEVNKIDKDRIYDFVCNACNDVFMITGADLIFQKYAKCPYCQTIEQPMKGNILYNDVGNLVFVPFAIGGI